jgi:site-specific recombinase XerC
MSIVRDRALIAVMTGCGLRRFEISDLQITQIKKIQGRWAFTDIKGKGDRYRTVAIPEYAMKCLEKWLEINKSIGKTDRIFFSIRKNGEIGNTMITPQGIRDIVVKHSKNILEKEVLPHDMRRTYAHLSYKAGAPLRQVQLSLGHSSIRTTEIYLGLDQDLTNAPGDYIKIEI